MSERRSYLFTKSQKADGVALASYATRQVKITMPLIFMVNQDEIEIKHKSIVQ